MKRRLARTILIGTGVALVAAGLVILLGVAPRFRVVRDSTTISQRFEGTLRTSIDIETLESISSPRLSIQHFVRVVDTHGGIALIRDETVSRIPQGRLRRTVVHYAIDRSTAECTDDYPERWAATTGFWPRLGLVGMWPYDVDRADYALWVDAYRRTVPLRFAGEVVHAGTGLTAYRFTASGEQQPMSPEEIAFLKLPTEVPSERIRALQENPDVNLVLRRLLPGVLEAWTEPTVPVSYSWEFHSTYWVEPRTGVVLDMRSRDYLRVGVAEEVVRATPLLNLPAVQRAALEIVVEESQYASTDASIADAVALVDERLAALQLYATTLPIVLVVLGLAVGTTGALLRTGGRRS